MIGITRPRRTIAAIVGLALLAWTAACSSPTGPTPTPGAPTLSCPVDVSLQSLTNSPLPVTYQVPVAIGGSVPVTVSCVPPSGSAFAPGATPVRCTATDSAGRTGTCAFSVRVAVPPTLRVTRFLAFGDSMTEGVVSPAPSFRLLATPESYPSKLHPMLAARYPAQSIAMTNAGKAGEWAVDGALRLPGLLQSVRPDAVLLMEGANDLNQRQEAGIPTAAAAMRQMVTMSQAAGAYVFLATLPAQRPGAPRGFAPQVIAPYNAQLALVALQTGATLVDVYAAIGNPPPTALLGADGLHPTEAGYVRIAETFFERIRATQETPGVLTSGEPPPVLGRVVPEPRGGRSPSNPVEAGSHQGVRRRN